MLLNLLINYHVLTEVICQVKLNCNTKLPDLPTMPTLPTCIIKGKLDYETPLLNYSNCSESYVEITCLFALAATPLLSIEEC